MKKYTNDKISKLDIEINKLSEDLKMKDENFEKLRKEIIKIETELQGKREERDKEINRLYEEFAQKAKEERKKEFLDVYGEDIEKRFISASARLDDLPIVITANYHRIDLNEIKDVIEENCGCSIRFKDSIDEKTGKNYSIDPYDGYARILDNGINGLEILSYPKDKRVEFSLAKGGIVEFLSGTSFFDTGHGLQCCSRADDEKRKEFMQKYAEKVKNIEKKCVVAQKKEEVKENPFTKMTKGEMYRLDIDKLPEVSLVGEINIKLADYKKDLEALKSGEMLTFGRTKNEDETIEIDRGEKLVSFEDKSNHVSRKHLSVVNFGGNLYMQDRSLNGTGMREASKTDKAKTLIKPMEKER